jgi:hypothetical protein
MTRVTVYRPSLLGGRDGKIVFVRCRSPTVAQYTRAMWEEGQYNKWLATGGEIGTQVVRYNYAHWVITYNVMIYR